MGPVTNSPKPPRPDAGSFALLLRQYRRDAALSQEQLAERAGLSPDAVSSLERGIRRRPHPSTITLLADALGLDDKRRTAFSAEARDVAGSAIPTDTPRF